MSCHLAKYGCKMKTAKKCTAFTPFNHGKTKRFYAVLNGALQGTGISVCARVCVRACECVLEGHSFVAKPKSPSFPLSSLKFCQVLAASCLSSGQHFAKF